MEIVRKISTKMCGWPKTAVIKELAKYDAGKVVPLLHVLGIAGDRIDGDSDNGPWTALIGTFRAKNLETGKEYQSNRCFIPGAALDMILGQMAVEEKNANIQFAFEIGACLEETSAVGYEWRATPLIEFQDNDPLAGIESKLLVALEQRAAITNKSKRKKEEKEAA